MVVKAYVKVTSVYKFMG